MLISLVLLLLCHVVCAEVVTYNWDVEDWVVDFKVPRSSRSSLFDNGKLFENRDDLHTPCARQIKFHFHFLFSRFLQRPTTHLKRPAERVSPFKIPDENRKGAILINGM